MIRVPLRQPSRAVHVKSRTETAVDKGVNSACVLHNRRSNSSMACSLRVSAHRMWYATAPCAAAFRLCKEGATYGNTPAPCASKKGFCVWHLTSQLPDQKAKRHSRNSEPATVFPFCNTAPRHHPDHPATTTGGGLLPRDSTSSDRRRLLKTTDGAKFHVC